MAVQRPPAFRGRTSELEALDRLLENVRGGQSGVLVIRGEAGVGKTALLRHAVGQARGFKVVQIAGIESEMELPFAGLHQLFAPMLSRLDALPEPQRDALSIALGLSFGDAPDRFLVGVASLTLLAEVAEEQPCCAWSTTRNGWTAPRSRSWPSPRDGCWRSRWRSYSRCDRRPRRAS